MIRKTFYSKLDGLIFTLKNKKMTLAELKKEFSFFHLIKDFLIVKRIIEQEQTKGKSIQYFIDSNFVVFPQDYDEIYSFYLGKKNKNLPAGMEEQIQFIDRKIISKLKSRITDLEIEKQSLTESKDKRINELIKKHDDSVFEYSKCINEKLVEIKHLKELLQKETKVEVVRIFGIPVIKKTIKKFN